MTFADERLRAERAMEDDGTTQYPPAARRFHDALQCAGMTAGDLGALCGVGRSEYQDVELYDSEVFECVDVAHLSTMTGALRVSAMKLLFGAEPANTVVAVSFADVAAGLREAAQRRGQTLDEFGDSIGWDVTRAAEQPEALGEFNLVGLYDVCRAIGLDWVGVLTWLEERGRRTSG